MAAANMKVWSAVARPPATALRQIGAGRLKGKTDINPQWRYQAMTEQFGPCGVGWKYEIKRIWTEPTINDQVFAFAEVNVFIKDGESWSEPIPGIGGSMSVTKESSGLHASDECFKMAVTDALSVAMKMIGVAADIYAGMWDGTKYKENSVPQYITEDQQTEIRNLLNEVRGDDHSGFLKFLNVPSIDKIQVGDYQKAMSSLKLAKEKKAENDAKEKAKKESGK